MKHTLSRIALLTALLSFPWPAAAALSVQIADTIAGLGAPILVEGLPKNAQVSLSVSGPDGRTELAATADATGEAKTTLKPADTEIAGLYTVNVRQGGSTIGTAQFEVMPDTFDTEMSDIRSMQKTIDADGSDEAAVIVTLRDRYGNPLPDRPVTLLSSRPSDAIESDSSETDSRGQQRFYVSASKAGSMTLRALDLLSGAPLQSTATLVVGENAYGGNDEEYDVSPSRVKRSPLTAQISNFDVIERFEITAPATMVAGEEAPKVAIRAVDRNGATVQDYTGTVRFDAPNDPDAVLPGLGRYTFRESNLGQKEFPITLKFSTAGEQTLRVEDENDPTIYGEVVIMVTGGTGHNAGPNTIEITNFQDGDTIASRNITLEGIGPKFANLIVQGGEEDVEGDTDADGRFAIPITLKEGQRDFTIRVRDESGRYDSGPLLLSIDGDAPEIKKVMLAPENPQPNEQVLVTVESDPKLSKVTVRLPDGPEVSLLELSMTPGTYQGFLTAPAIAGTYQPIVAATDTSGNVTEVRTMLTIVRAGLSKVLGLQAEPKLNSVGLRWDGVPGGVDSYRIYVGESPTDFLYTLETGRDVSRATVAGLSPGKIYYFAVTALKNGEESSETSDLAEVRVLGLSLEVAPQNSSLVLKWPMVSSQLPLSSYLIEYGVEEGNFTEKRLINGELKTFTIRDLLNGVTYFIRLTPVTITGDQLMDLAASGEGTPNGTGFQVGPTDPIPFDPANPPMPHKPVALDGTGVPSFIWWLIVSAALVCGYFVWHRNRSLRHSDAFLKAVQLQYHR
jgi:hypothetical protein